jgi:hypothetical protein
MISRAVVGACVLVVTLTACGSGGESGTTAPTPDISSNTLTARIGDVPFAASSLSAWADGRGYFVIRGSSGDTSIVELLLSGIVKPGTYPLGVSRDLAGGYGQLGTLADILVTCETGAAGSVTIRLVSPKRIAGSFSYAAHPICGFQARPGDAVMVSSGVFDLPVTGPDMLTLPLNQVSTVTAGINGVAFTPARASTMRATTPGILTMELSAVNHAIVIRIEDFTGPGAYSIGGNTARTVTYSTPDLPVVSTWGGSGALSSGTVVITANTEFYVTGTMNVSLQPRPTSVGVPVNIIASFNMAVR